MNFADFEYIKPAHITGSREGLYIDPRNGSAYINTKSALNFEAIDLNGVNNISIHRFNDGSFYIFQTGGYTVDRGLFIDEYKYKEAN